MYISRDSIIKIHKEFFLEGEASVPPGVSLMSTRKMWRSTWGGNVVVAVLDTGIDYTHPDLAGNVKDGASFISSEEDYIDYNGHGTHVAGTIAAEGRLLGVAPRAGLLAVKVLDKNGFGPYSSIIQGLKWARSWRGSSGERVNVINMSMGGPFPNNSLHQEIVKTIAAGITVVCAAGNSGDADPDTKEVSYPAYYYETLAVGAVDLLTGIAGFSNSNDKIDIVAPGVKTYSTYPQARYVELSGTSMACPHIAGAVALIYSRYYKRFGEYPLPEQVKQMLRFQAIDLGEAGFDELYGFGLFSFDIGGGKAIQMYANKNKYRLNNREYTLKQATVTVDNTVFAGIAELCGIMDIDTGITLDHNFREQQIDIWGA